MFAGINICISSGLVNYLGTHALCLRVFILRLKMVAILPNKSLTNINKFQYRLHYAAESSASVYDVGISFQHSVNWSTYCKFINSSTNIRKYYAETRIYCLLQYITVLQLH